MKRLTILLMAFLCLNISAQNESSPIIFIYDASGSMWGQLQGKSKMDIAVSVLSETISNFDTEQMVGLVAYGHRKKGDCNDVEFLIPSDNKNKDKVNAELSRIKPLGKTPLAYSATLVINSLKESKESATIILITDGIESCGGNICDVVGQAKEAGIDFKLHIVGFGLKPGETEQLRCAAAAGDGNYYDAADAGGLSDVLDEAVEQSVDKPAGNFGVYATKNGAPIDAYVIAFRSGTDEEAGRLRTYGDTTYMYLKSGTYNLQVSPLATDIASISVNEVVHDANEPKVENISFDGGIMEVYGTNNDEGWDCTVRVKDQSGKTVATQRTYGRAYQFELNAGVYDVEFLALKLEGTEVRKVVEDQEVVTSDTIKTFVNFESGKLSIKPQVGAEIIDCVVKVIEKSTGKNVASARSYARGCEFLLNPADYEVNIKPIGKNKDKAAQTIDIALGQGAEIERIVNF